MANLMNKSNVKPFLSGKPLFMLMDGHAMVHRAWHAIQNPLTLKNTNQDVRAVYGFTNALIRAIQEWRPSHCAIAFDMPGPTFRHVKYSEYKAQRPKTPEELISQFPLVRKLVEAFGIPIYEMDQYEGDDILGTLCLQASQKGMDTIILTGDTDTLQLVSPTVRVALNRSVQDRVIYDLQGVLDRYGGLSPDQQPHIKALQGDASDNIKGVPGIGVKTAIKLIQQFGSIDGLYANLDEVTPVRIKTLLEENEDSARQSLDLTTIVNDVPIVLDEESCRFWMYDRENVLDFLKDMEFSSIVARVPMVDSPMRPQAIEAHQGTLIADSIVEANGDYQTIQNIGDLESLISDIKEVNRFAFDVETTSLDAMKASVVGISFSLKPNTASYLPLGHIEGSQINLVDAINLLKPIFEDVTIEKYAHNANYDISVLANNGIAVKGITFDTMIAAHLLGEKSLGLKSLAFTRLSVEMTRIEFLIGTGRNQKTMDQVSIEDVAPYAAADADLTYRLKELFDNELRGHDKLMSVFNDVEVPLIPVLVKMQSNGVALDDKILQAMSSTLGIRLAQVEHDILDSVGHSFMISSTQQLADVLFNELRLPKTKKTKTGYSTDASVLEHLKVMVTDGDATDADPRSLLILDRILEFRELSKLKSTYVDALPQLVNASTGRIHTNYNQTGSATGRISSNYPNLQNIPVRSELGREVRKAFISEDSSEWTLIAADYSQIELRVLAHLSEDKSLVEAFLNDEDIHSATASQVFGVSIDSVTLDMRRIAKIMNFGVIYGLSAYGISQQTDLPRDEGAKFIEGYFSKYPGIKGYLDGMKEEVKKTGYLETVCGRRRYIPEVNSPNYQIRQAAERMAVNMPIQGTAADIVKIAMINIDHAMTRKQLRSRMILQVHDELIFEVPKDEITTMLEIVQELMPGALDLSVPLKVEIKTGTNWGSLDSL